MTLSLHSHVRSRTKSQSYPLRICLHNQSNASTTLICINGCRLLLTAKQWWIDGWGERRAFVMLQKSIKIDFALEVSCFFHFTQMTIALHSLHGGFGLFLFLFHCLQLLIFSLLLGRSLSPEISRKCRRAYLKLDDLYPSKNLSLSFTNR